MAASIKEPGRRLASPTVDSSPTVGGRGQHETHSDPLWALLHPRAAVTTSSRRDHIQQKKTSSLSVSFYHQEIFSRTLSGLPFTSRWPARVTRSCWWLAASEAASGGPGPWLQVLPVGGGWTGDSEVMFVTSEVRLHTS